MASEETVQLELLQEALREGERVIDHQLKAAEELDDKLEQLTTLSVASIGAAFALSAFVAPKISGLGILYLIAFVAGGSLNGAAVYFFMRGYGVFGKGVDLGTGPQVGWLVEKADQSDWTLGRHLKAVLRGLETASRENYQMAERVARERKIGARFLLAAVIVYSLTTTAFLIRWSLSS